MMIGTKVVAKGDFGSVRAGDTGVYTFGADYVPGWDAGRFDVTLDAPRSRMIVQSHWTLSELLSYWTEVRS